MRFPQNILNEKNMRLERPSVIHHTIRIYTYIFIVPFGPRLVLITSCKPLDAEILMANACAARANSAFGFNKLIDDIIFFGTLNNGFQSKINKNIRDDEETKIRHATFCSNGNQLTGIGYGVKLVIIVRIYERWA